LQHLEDMRGPMPNRMDNRFHASRDRGRPVGPHRRGFPIDKSRVYILNIENVVLFKVDSK